MSSMSPRRASIARLRISVCRDWIVSARAFSSSSVQRWQVWQALLTFRSGLLTWWSETFIAPAFV